MTFGENSQLTTIGDYAFQGCTGLASIVIPDSVTTIGEDAFRDCTSLTSITLPFVGATKDGTENTHFGYIFGASSYLINSDCVPTSLKEVIITGGTTIGDYAFALCTSLTSIVITDSVTTIGEYAFIGCTSLTSITIPDSVTTIGSSAFYGFTSLTSITVDENNPNYKSIDGNLYSKDGKTLIQYAKGKIATSFVIPDSVTRIGEYAFSNCDSLTSVTIGNSVTTIGDRAFLGCTSLTSIVIPDSVTTIREGAFRGCSALESLTIPFVGVKAGDTGPSTNQYPLGYLFGASSYTGGVATEQHYYGSSSSSPISTTYYIPSSLKSVTVTGGYIPRGAFYNCNNITNITLGDDVTTISDYAFYNCTSLTKVYYTGTEEQWEAISIGSYNDPLITAIRHYNYVAKYTFELNEDGESYTITGLSEDFEGTEVVIPAEYKGKPVTSIGASAFYNCTSLTSVTFGANSQLTTIGDYAFNDCYSLKDVYYTGTEEEWNNIAVGSDNIYLTNATIHYNYVNE